MHCSLRASPDLPSSAGRFAAGAWYRLSSGVIATISSVGPGCYEGRSGVLPGRQWTELITFEALLSLATYIVGLEAGR